MNLTDIIIRRAYLCGYDATRHYHDGSYSIAGGYKLRIDELMHLAMIAGVYDEARKNVEQGKKDAWNDTPVMYNAIDSALSKEYAKACKEYNKSLVRRHVDSVVHALGG